MACSKASRGSAAETLSTPARRSIHVFVKRKLGVRSAPGSNTGITGKGWPCFSSSALAVERKPHFAFLQSAKFSPDERGHGSDVAQSLFELSRPWEASYKLVSVEEYRDAARAQQLLDRDDRRSVDTVL